MRVMSPMVSVVLWPSMVHPGQAGEQARAGGTGGRAARVGGAGGQAGRRADERASERSISARVVVGRSGGRAGEPRAGGGGEPARNEKGICERKA
jgi:hypothetical protein